MKRGWLHAPGATSGHSKKQKRPGAASPVALLLAVCMLCTLAVPAAAQEWSTPETAALAEETPAGETPDPTATPAPTAEPAADPAPEDGGEADPAPATAETAQEDEPEQPEQDTPAGPATAETAQEAVEPGDTVPVEETLKFATEDVSILVKVSGEATVAEEAALPPEGAQKIVAEPADETETVETEPAEGEQDEQDEQDPAADEAEPAVQALSAQKAAAAAPDAETAPVQEAELEVAALPENQPEYKQAVAYIEESAGEDGVLMVSALRFDFYYQGQPLDVSACEVTAEVRPTEALMNEARTVAAEKQAEADAAAEAAVQALAEDGEEEEPLEKPETRQGVEFVALQSGGDTAERLDGAFIEADTQETPVLTAALTGASPVMMLAARSALNPHFTVQYYANIEVTDRDANGYLKIFNTDNGGNNEGGKLPTNGGNTPITGLYLEDAGNGKQKIKTSMKLTELYTANEYTYFEAPGLAYVNVFRENGNYGENYEVWVLKEKDGANPLSTDREDWTVYENIKNPTQLPFTNSEDKYNSDPNKYILIKEGTVIRLVADQTTGDYDNAATFYDYDITDDGRTTYDGINGQHGINSGSNYTGSGAKLAFGNANTGTGLENEKWGNNTLNQYNRSGGGYEGCTFGLVTGLDGEGHIIYANGVDAPNLFDDGNATGKTTHTDWSLNFNRQGDTYTLSAVNGAKLDGLEYFNNPQTPGKDPYTHIWTNNFWPLDGRPSTDGLTGYYNDRGEYSGYDGNGLFPVSDDGQDHNNMFGMQYTLEFELTEDYVGPLEYYFFGDDDMWVFLDGRLVCDIGGVHSSVGAYVNLWDYIAKGDAGKHTLKFYYTERGLSGSTCYMQFTLPSVSQVPVTYQNGQLKVEKKVVGTANPDAEFSFEIEISHDTQDVTNSDYSIVRYSPDGTKVIETTLLTGGKGTFKLKADEYVIIDYLQYGTKYKITETDCAAYIVTSTHNDNVKPSNAKMARANTSGTEEGQTQNGYNSLVTFTNTPRPKLPETGGSGTLLYTTGGTALLAAALLYDIRRRKAQRSKPQ